MPSVAPNTKEQAPIAGDTAVLARRYAGALFELAEGQKVVDEVAADMRTLRVLTHDSAEFKMIASQPRLTRAQLVKAMQAIAVTAKFNVLTGNFLALVAQNRRLSTLGAVIDAFLDVLAERRGEFTADIRTAKKLSPAQEESLATTLRDVAGGKVHLVIREDESLLGGLTVKLGSRLIDASVRTKLQRLERQLKSGKDLSDQAA